ncbi:hypothetical protein A6V39_00170 [Candidatus Mycoplasma haematobovis]|uniref:Uncharacterized protein n=1 Tax=Candidatus Mycoplasma haematobovis TaxID=432608 RepID=A0A1A9QEB1_9MOLU|nr:hypothetical protein [Candidatus Mycoplasma haematobovis]OAL10464.1 hypothetical protein A6V39_00170 [Candidatus Mycoplasma haematobovis]
MNTKTALISIGGIGTLSGIGVAGFWFTQPKNIGEYLTSIGKTLLDTKGNTNEKEWKILYTKHKLETVPQAESKIAKLLSTDIGNNESAGITKLKQECETLFKEPISKNDDEFKAKKEKATNWCTLESPIIEEANKATANPSGNSGSSSGQGSADPVVSTSRTTTQNGLG